MTASPLPPLHRTGRSWRWFFGGLLAVVVVGIVSVTYWHRGTIPLPPGEDLEGLEPVVRAAIGAARRRVLDEPRSADAWGELGEVFLANELDIVSSACFAQAERLDPEEPRWPYFQAGLLLNQGEWHAALPLLQRTVERCDSQTIAPLHLLGETLMRLGRLDEAEVQFRQTLVRHPGNPRASYNLGLVAISRQEWPTARDLFSSCLGNPSTRQKARFQLVLVLGRLGDRVGADEFESQAQRMPKDLDWPDPFVAEYMARAVKNRNRYRMVEQLEAAGRYREAVVILSSMTEETPNDVLPFLTLGKILGQMGDYNRAETSLRKALLLDPHMVQPHYYLSLVLYLRGESVTQDKKADGQRSQAYCREAADLARQAIRLQPDYGFAHMSLGLALKRLGKPTEAIDALQTAVRCNPELGEIHYYLGETLAERGDRELAQARLEHALRLAEPHAPWRQAALDRLAALRKTGAKK